MSENTEKHVLIQTVLWFSHATFQQQYAGSHRPEFGESELYDMVKETSAGLGAVSKLKDLGVDMSKNTKIDKAVLEVRVDASVGRGIAVRRGAGRIHHIATPTLWVQKLTQNGIVNVTKIHAVSNQASVRDMSLLRS